MSDFKIRLGDIVEHDFLDYGKYFKVVTASPHYNTDPHATLKVKALDPEFIKRYPNHKGFWIWKMTIIRNLSWNERQNIKLIKSL